MEHQPQDFSIKVQELCSIFEKRVNSRAEICFWADRKGVGQSSLTQAMFHVQPTFKKLHENFYFYQKLGRFLYKAKWNCTVKTSFHEGFSKGRPQSKFLLPISKT